MPSNQTTNSGLFVPGDPRINRSGRPPKERSLTAMLEQEIATIDLAKLLRNAIATGMFVFPESERAIPIKDFSELVQLYKFVFKQIDPNVNVAAKQPRMDETSSLSDVIVPVELLEELLLAQIRLLKEYLPAAELAEFMERWEEAMQPLAAYLE